MALLDDMKGILRVTDDEFEFEIEALIDGAKAELVRRGVRPSVVMVEDDDELDPLVRNAIIFYCKSTFSFDNSDKTFFQSAFNRLVAGLLNSDDYNVAAGEGQL